MYGQKAKVNIHSIWPVCSNSENANSKIENSEKRVSFSLPEATGQAVFNREKLSERTA